MKRTCGAMLALVVLAGSVTAAAEVVIETVFVGNPGNPGILSGTGAGGDGPDRICGSVRYTYEIGKYEVTTAQYVAFLNAVAATDTFGLYDTEMTWGINSCQIERHGSPGSYTYSVPTEWANHPVNYVNWGDAARFANWLHNGQPVGVQGPGTTEDGAYLLNGAMTNPELMAVVRSPNAMWALPTEDEWYKAAYHKNDGVTANYWLYPTSSNVPPTPQIVDPDPGNHANYGFFNLNPPYGHTQVGEFENTYSPYGAFDMAGNLWEWTEAIILAGRGTRGGGFGGEEFNLHGPARDWKLPNLLEDGEAGFRVAFVPEPGAAVLLMVGAMAFRRRR